MMSESQLRVTFRGVRGSYPVPGDTTVHYGGNTSCVSVEVGDRMVILDGGSGIIGLGNELVASPPGPSPRPLLVLFSHYHFDHILGFPFFKPAFRPKQFKVMLYAPAFDGSKNPKDALDRLMISPLCPFDLRHMAAVEPPREIDHGTTFVWTDSSKEPVVHPGDAAALDDTKALVVETLLCKKLHPRDGIVFFKLRYKGRSVVYATDVEGVQPELVQFAMGTDLLIHDAQYFEDEYLHPDNPTKGWGHSTGEMACDVAKQAGVKQLALFHHNPDHDDATIRRKGEKFKAIFSGSFSAIEGQTIDL